MAGVSAFERAGPLEVSELNMAAAALLFAGATSALDLMQGLFGYLAAKEGAGIAESRGRMLRLEAEADAQRYAEQARGFRASQKVAFLKSGVELSGSPLDILDETARITQENLSAIRARGVASQQEQNDQASMARIGGRAALIAGITQGISRFGMAAYQSGKTAESAQPRNNTVTGWRGTPWL